MQLFTVIEVSHVTLEPTFQASVMADSASEALQVHFIDQGEESWYVFPTNDLQLASGQQGKGATMIPNLRLPTVIAVAKSLG